MTLQFHKTDLQLQRRIREQTDEVGLCGYLQGHQVQNGNLQGTDILGSSPRIVHHKDILILQNIDGGQSIW